jgi:large subunit ribosomal protein L2
MGIKTFKPTTPSRRAMSGLTFEEITKDKPEKSLTKGKKSFGGRNCYGRTTVRFRGGGHKRRLRDVDFKRVRDGIPARVVAIEYDPNRTSNIALIAYADGVKSYIVAPQGLKVGQTVQSGTGSEIQVGNVLRLREIPVGTTVCCIELKPGKGAQIVRSAGASAQLMARENNLATLRLPSTEMRYVPLDSRAMIGQVGNSDHENQTIGKAGRTRWLGKRPHNRGISMNPVDHPLGGGEGSTAGGRHPCSPWGKPSKGVKTRNPRNANDRMIIRRRKKKKK